MVYRGDICRTYIVDTTTLKVCLIFFYDNKKKMFKRRQCTVLKQNRTHTQYTQIEPIRTKYKNLYSIFFMMAGGLIN